MSEAPDAADAPPPSGWAQAAMAAVICAVDPAGTGGAVLRASAGPVRDGWLGLLRDLLPGDAIIRRVPLGIPDGRLLGGLDLAATLRAGRPVAERGLMAEAHGGVLLLAMAERLSMATAARINAAIDCGEIATARDGVERRNPARVGVIALDEGIADDEGPPPSLVDRLAFHLDLSSIGPREALNSGYSTARVAAARLRLPQVDTSLECVEALCETAIALGIGSIRATLLAMQVARISAALAGRGSVAEYDAALAARLVLAPRATMLPVPPSPETSPAESRPGEPPPDVSPPRNDVAAEPQPAPSAPAPREAKPSDADPDRADNHSLNDLLLAAAQAAIPPNLLEKLGLQRAAQRAAAPGRSGAVLKSGSRGRPAGVRQGEPRAGSRLNIVETLRAAAPWQRLRRAHQSNDTGPRLSVRREDFRVTRYEQRTESTIIFVVDASRSSAVNRLAEAKGAVELLLADCYARRDRVAVVAFRGRGAEMLLPPTRSLVRAKRQLAGLPGGGGTPLAAGLEMAARVADAARRRGESPTIVLLTDGRANVALDGGTGRDRAEADALAAGRKTRAAGFTSLLVDTAPRPQAAAQRFAAEMGARYLPLPYASATSLSSAVRAIADPARREP